MRRYFLASTVLMLGATAWSGSAVAQNHVENHNEANHHRGGGGGNPNPNPNPGGGGGGGAVDPGPRGGTGSVGGPLPGLNANEIAFFTASTAVFNEVDAVVNGLGPRFNMDGCGGCHAFPAAGGSSPPTNPQVAVATTNGATNTVPAFITANGPVREVRFVNNPDGTPDGGVHDLFTITGRADAPGCSLKQPDFAAAVAANNAIFRIPTPTFGLGLVEAVPDSGLQAAAAATSQQASSLGISTVFNHSGNDGTITRFGWKAQNKSLLIFAGEAYNVEQGVTNDAFPNERETDPNCQFNPLPESTTNFTDGTNGASPAAGFSQDIVDFAAFMRMLAPPTPASGSSTTASGSGSMQMASAGGMSVLSAASGNSSNSPGGGGSGSSTSHGLQVFTNVGCGVCHIMSQTTGNSVMTGQSNVTFQPFSDWALHQMGTGLADGVSQGGASGSQFRSAPLWGVGQRLFFLHDGRTSDLMQAIKQHASNGSEANGVIRAFNMLSTSDQQSVLNFLRSL